MHIYIYIYTHTHIHTYVYLNVYIHIPHPHRPLFDEFKLDLLNVSLLNVTMVYYMY